MLLLGHNELTQLPIINSNEQEGKSLTLLEFLLGFNSLLPGRCGSNFRILQHIIMIDILSISHEISPRWIPEYFT